MSFKAFSRDSDNNILLSTKSKRSQSALEYMMTYGWAILIIVIVAVILYSMGIFNPSSSITFTSSGFSPFTVSSSLCNNLGYKIAVLAGPIPNNANSLQIDKVYLTSATGANATTASYTLKNPVTLKSGQSATILIPNVACNAANIHYSISANIQYSYTASTLGLQTVNTTGTVAGTSIAGKPSVLTSYEPLTITNSQSSATPNPFQQMVNFTSSDSGWTSISTSNFGQNVEFFYYNGTVIPSWLENYTSSHALWWLKIAAIPAGSSETVYVGFAPTSTNLFNTVNDGEAPQIPCIEEGVTNTSQCSIYAEYDDGVSVFNFYSNFIGTTLPSTFTVVGTPTYSVSNGLTETSVSNSEFIADEIPFNAQNYISEIYGHETDTSGNDRFFSVVTGYNGGNYGIYFECGSSTEQSFCSYQRGGGSVVVFPGTISGTTTNAIFSIWENSTTSFGMYNYILGLTETEYGTLTTAYYQLGGTNSVTNFYQWIRQRAAPPNGVMPSVTFGSVS